MWYRQYCGSVTDDQQRLLVRVLLLPAYSTPVVAVALYVAVALVENPIPSLSGAEGSPEQANSDDHLFHEGAGARAEAGPGALVGSYAPYFVIELEYGSLVTLTDLFEVEKPAFLYF